MCRTHAADVLRTLHVIATRGGLIRHVVPERQLDSGDLLSRQSPSHRTSPTLLHDASNNNVNGTDRATLPANEAFMLLTVYLAAIIHDFDHRGVNNHFLVRSADPLALLYNDASPMENHHVAAAFTALRKPQFDFLDSVSSQVSVGGGFISFPELTEFPHTACTLDVSVRRQLWTPMSGT